jgi:hypothetical protein
MSACDLASMLVRPACPVNNANWIRKAERRSAGPVPLAPICLVELPVSDEEGWRANHTCRSKGRRYKINMPS